MSTEFHNGRVVLHAGNCLDVVRGMADASIDAVVTDPPYALVSIGKRFGAEGAPGGGGGQFTAALPRTNGNPTGPHHRANGVEALT